MDVHQRRKSTSLNGLTVYPPSIQCAATRTDQEGGHNEADRIIVEHFNRTLAEVALAIAARKSLKQSDDS